MAYHGYSQLIKQFLHQQVPPDRPPTILEVGVDRGVMLVPLVVFLARTRASFTVVGVDVMVQEQVRIMLQNLDLTPSQQAYCIEGNSLEVLPKMVEQGLKFDVLLLDGDHNYHTVAKELELLEDLTYPSSLVIIDDYDGRWSNKDLWYSEREGYENVKIATPRQQSDRHGVKAAVDEWLDKHPEWQKAQPVQGEPVLLMRRAV